MLSIRYSICVYQENGYCPYELWSARLDKATRARIGARISRFEDGHFGDYKNLGNGVFEARFFIGPGYRVYFAIYRSQVILLLNGGDKSSQSKDILKAKSYLIRYLEEQKNANKKS